MYLETSVSLDVWQSRCVLWVCVKVGLRSACSSDKNTTIIFLGRDFRAYEMFCDSKAFTIVSTKFMVSIAAIALCSYGLVVGPPRSHPSSVVLIAILQSQQVPCVGKSKKISFIITTVAST